MKQIANPEMVELLTPEFQRRNEPNFSWAEAISAGLALPGLVGFWSGFHFDSGGDLPNLIPMPTAHTMVLQGNPQHGLGAALIQYMLLDGTGDYFTRADHADFDITGTETYIAAARRGVTLGGWYYFGNAAGSQEIMLSKWNAGTNDKSYALWRAADGTIKINLSDDGTTTTSLAHSETPAQSTWFFAAGGLDRANGRMKIQINNDMETADTFANNIYNGAANVAIGATSIGAAPMTGRFCLQFICSAFVKNATLKSFYQTTRSMFGQ